MNRKYLLNSFIVIVILFGIAYHFFVAKRDGEMASFKHEFIMIPEVLTGTKVYRMTNISGTNIVIDIADYNGRAQAGYANKIEPNHYSEFVHQGPKLLFACFDENEHTHLRCSNVVKLEELRLPKSPVNSNEGNYWQAENKAG